MKTEKSIRVLLAILTIGFIACTSEESTNNGNNGNNGNLGEIVGTLSLDYATDVAVAGSHAFVACKSRGVAVVDISNVQSPTLVTTLATHGESRELFIANNKLYVADFTGGITVFDIANPAAPTELDNYEATGEHVNDVFATAQNIYEAGGEANDGLLVIRDASGNQLGTYINNDGTEEDRGFSAVWVDGNYAYAGTNGGWLHIIDVSNPASPANVATYYNQGTAGHEPWILDVAVSSGKAYLADWGAGLIALDVSNPASPQELGVFTAAEDGPNFYDVILDGNKAYTANGWGGMAVVDVSNPASMTLALTTNPSSSSYQGIALYNNYAVIADNGVQQLVIVKVK